MMDYIIDRLVAFVLRSALAKTYDQKFDKTIHFLKPAAALPFKTVLEL